MAWGFLKEGWVPELICMGELSSMNWGGAAWVGKRVTGAETGSTLHVPRWHH